MHLIKTDTLYMFYHGWVESADELGKLKLWINWWLDNTNGSTTIAGQISAYEYPMTDNAPAWLHWLSNNWGVKDNVDTESQCMVPLNVYLPSGGSYVVSPSQFSMERFNSGLIVPNSTETTPVQWTHGWLFYGLFLLFTGGDHPGSGNQWATVNNFDTFQITSNGYPLSAITTPQLPKPIMPVCPQTGLLGAVWMGLSGIAGWIGANIIFGGLGLWPMCVAFLNTIAGWLGMPNGFSILLHDISVGWSWVVNSFLSAFTVMAAIFTFMATTIGAFLWACGQALVSFANMFVTLGQWINGGAGGAANLVAGLDLPVWFTLALIFYPLYLIILWDQKGMAAVIEQLSWIFGILSWLAHFFMTVIHTIITVINAVIEAVPVVE
jgi:hypothetical protein